MLTQLLQSITPRQFYERLLGCALPDENARGDVFVNCPFHEGRTGYGDETASMSVNLNPENAGMYKCFGGTCGAHGTLIKFYEEYRKYHGVTIGDKDVRGEASFRVMAQELTVLFDIDPSTLQRALVDDETLAQWAHDLHKTKGGKRALKHLLEERGLTSRIISDFRLGFDEQSGRVTIPIRDADGSVVNVRKWLPVYARTTKQLKRNKITSLPGCGTPPRLFPYDALRQQQIIICEGELDCIVLHGLGLNAVTSTGGVTAFDKSWIRYFTDKNVVLMLDSDAAGDRASDELLEKLYKVVRSIKSIVLPEKDVTDYVVSIGELAGEAIRQMIHNEPSFYMKDELHKTHRKVNLFQAAERDMIGKNIKLSALVAGKDDQPFAIPKRITCTCHAAKPSKTCPGCPRLQDMDSVEKTIELDSADVVNLVQSGVSHPALKKLFNVTCRNCAFDLHEDSYETVEEVQLIPDTDSSESASYEYTVRNAYAVGYGLRLNHRYDFLGRTVVDDTARVTHVFESAQMVDRFRTNMTPDEKVTFGDKEQTVMDWLSTFQVDKGQLVNEKLHDIYTDFEVHVTQIKGRRDVLQACDLTWHSPLNFNFGDKYIHRGWVSTLIIGDSQCGKSETVIQLHNHLRTGALFSGESISRAGIIGAYGELPGKRGVRFRLGVAPLNDGGLLVIDEASGMSDEQFDELTNLRSTGEAMSTKFGQHNRFPARVRLIMLSNPRKTSGRYRQMSTFPQGCMAITDLVGGDADIARFDMFVTVASDEVPLSEINAPVIIERPLRYDSNLCNLLIQWVWTRRANDWEFSRDAQDLIFDTAEKMSREYDPSIPIVAAGSHRWTIARLAAAVAARVFSTDDGHRVNVSHIHVEAARDFLYQTYNKPSMGYHVYSEKRKRENTIADDKLLRKVLDSYPYEVFILLRDKNRFTTTEFADETQLDKAAVKMLLPQLKALNALFTSGGYWYTSAGMRKFVNGDYRHKGEATYIADLTDQDTEIEGDATGEID